MNFLGIGSGLDLSTMLDGLVQVASESKVKPLARREIEVEDSISGLGMLKSSLSDLQSASDALKDSSLFDAMVPSITQPASGDIISVEVGDTAVSGSYDIQVQQLAGGSQVQAGWRSVKYQSDAVADVSNPLSGGVGRLSFSIDGGAAQDLDFTGGESLSDIASAIDGLTGISASVVDGRLEYYADGLDEQLSVTSSDGGGGSAPVAFDSFTTAGSMNEQAYSSKSVGSALAGEVLTFGANGESFSYTLDGNETLESLAVAINGAESNFGVTANVIDGRLVYKSSTTGDGNDLEVTGGSAALDSFSTTAFAGGAGAASVTSNASSAIIIVDGITVTNESNTFDDAISGLTITAKSESVDNSGTLESAGLAISNNSSAISDRVNKFAASYNKLREQMNALQGEVNDDGDFVAGKLTNDPILRNIESVLNGLITKQVDGADEGLDTLYSVGLEIESDGTLNVDSDRLSSAVNNNFSGLKALFASGASAEEGGIADQISSQIDNYVGFTGIIKSQEDTFNEQKSDIEDQYESIQRYIDSYEETLKKQFTALDTTMAQMSATMSYVQSQLAGLSQIK